jgi:hypothetical protein
MQKLYTVQLHHDISQANQAGGPNAPQLQQQQGQGQHLPPGQQLAGQSGSSIMQSLKYNAEQQVRQVQSKVPKAGFLQFNKS